MGFIKNTFIEMESQYITMQDLVLYVKALDNDEASLSETAKFILLKYPPIKDFPFLHVDEAVFQKEISGKFSLYDYEKSKDESPFHSFLEFVAEYDVFDDGVSEHNPNLMYNPNSDLYIEKSAALQFLSLACSLENLPDLDIFLQKQKEEEKVKEQADKILSKEDVKGKLQGLSDILSLSSENDKLKQENKELTEEIKTLRSKVLTFEIAKNNISPAPQVIEAAAIGQADIVDFELIQKHRKRAPEFEALIQTLKHYETKYDSGEQPQKKAVSATFGEKAGLSETSRRCEEAARILGLSEENF